MSAPDPSNVFVDIDSGRDRVSDDKRKSKHKTKDAGKSDESRHSSQSIGQSVTPPTPSTSTTSPQLDSVLTKLTDCLNQGFAMVQSSMQEMNCRMERQDHNLCDFLNDMNDTTVEEEQEVDLESDEPSDSIFTTISNTSDTGTDVGPALNADLANLLNKMLVEQMSDSTKKAKEDSYPHPQNVHSTKPPKTNRPVWEAMGGAARIMDAKLQDIQRDLLRSSLPIACVMGKLLDCQNDTATLNVPELLWMLSDSFKFLGTANVNLIKQRKEVIKHELPKTMQGLCRDPEDFSPSYLFGDNLNSKIKEVSELNKVKHIVQAPPRGTFRSRFSSNYFRGGTSTRARRRGFKPTRTFGGRKRYTPYTGTPSRSKNGNKGTKVPKQWSLQFLHFSIKPMLK